MFLATTGISEFWCRSSQVLFLGDWCCRYSNKSEWEHLNYTILPYPWAKADRIQAAFKYCTQTYEDILNILIDCLNTTIGVNKSKRYWRILIGEWLWRYVQVVYDRYVCLEEAFNYCSDLDTTLLDPACYQYLLDYNEFIQSTNSDLYNLQLISQILAAQGYSFNLKKHCDLSSTAPGTGKNRIQQITRCIDYLVYQLPNSVDALFCGNFRRFSWKSQFKFLLTSHFKIKRICVQPEYVKSDFKPDLNLRKRFSELHLADSFQKICIKLLKHQFPMIFLEGYKTLVDKADSALGKTHPKILISPVSWRFYPFEAAIIAKCVDKGSKLVGVQHGGGYGTYQVDSMLHHELKVCDRFISWGWGQENEKITALPVAKFHPVDKKKLHGIERVLFASNNVPVYFNIFQSSPIGPNFENYINWQLRFLSALDKKIYEKLVYRIIPKDYGWSIKKRLCEKHHDLKIENCSIPFLESAAKSDLVIVDNNQTTYLESIGQNIPTIIFWDSNTWRLNEKAKEFFDELESVGVYHRSPESTVDFINRHQHDISGWWESKPVKYAVNRFRNQFAYYANDWEAQWIKGINSLIKLFRDR